jgi:hypothetical protein
VWVWYPAAPAPDAERAAYLPELWAPSGQFLGLDTTGLRSNAVAGRGGGDRSVDVSGARAVAGRLPASAAGRHRRRARQPWLRRGGREPHLRNGRDRVRRRPDDPHEPGAVAGALGPQTGHHEERFRQRSAVCDYKAADLASVADRLGQLAADADGPLAGRIDPSRLGAFGHSFGGNAALEWCRNDRRCLAAANLDGASWTEVGRVGLNRPVLQVLAEHPEFAPSGPDAVAASLATDAPAYDAEKADLRRLADGSRAGPPRLHRAGAGATHLSFMDVPLLPLTGESPAKAMLAATQIGHGGCGGSRVTCS